MAGVKGPLMSLQATGSIGKTLTFSKWKTINVTKTHATPAQPNSPKQIKIRATFANLQALDKAIGITGRRTWDYQAGSQGKTGANLLLSTNLHTLYHATDLSALITSLAGTNAPAEPALTMTTITGGVRLQTPGATPPSSWTMIGVIILVIEDFNPTTKQVPLDVADASSPTPPPIDVHETGLNTGALYRGFAYSELVDDSGTTIFTRSVAASATAG